MVPMCLKDEQFRDSRIHAKKERPKEDVLAGDHEGAVAFFGAGRGAAQLGP